MVSQERDPRVVERPILFRGEMVRAILAGRKTQTRRLAKTPVPRDKVWLDDRTGLYFTNISHNFGNTTALRNPYGKPGDRLWVRESLNILDWDASDAGLGACVQYAADEVVRGWTHDEQGVDLKWGAGKKSIPSIHMPRWACRLGLDITDVRVERLQDISEEDAKAEGIRFHEASKVYGEGLCYATAKEAFRALWKSIHGKESWDANPWLWVISFKRAEDAK